ncbi:hypothetical protein X802_06425 [Thermococcus guaymasensis DSM 11113]|uniref:Uncharacterized protein n=1 Tax=Thermococcus guaymasensis DSM 11113 TaxID=1432656 RepID=A0A0X1KKN6_9EURY|nr:hypothetical protein [Thermococcus guaymasensis]AJC71833.1 hypothetical protein X802_06425 [Thermococcus guaymasensis DSM 11113]
MNENLDIECEIKNILRVEGPLSVAFITRFLNERGIECTRQKVERVLRNLVSRGVVVASLQYNRRKQYQLGRKD